MREYRTTQWNKIAKGQNMQKEKMSLFTFHAYEIPEQAAIITLDAQQCVLHIPLDSPPLNRVSLLEKLSAWTPPLRPASSQARFLKNTRKHKHEEMYETRGRHASCTQCTHGGQNTRSMTHVESKNRHNYRLSRLWVHCFLRHFANLIRRDNSECKTIWQTWVTVSWLETFYPTDLADNLSVFGFQTKATILSEWTLKTKVM